MSSFFALLVVYISFYVIRFENIPASENGALLIIPHFFELFATLVGHVYFQENNMDTNVIRLTMLGYFTHYRPQLAILYVTSVIQ